MREIVVISGKGGTGKTTVCASFAHLAESKVICDLDVDAPDLHILLQPALLAIKSTPVACIVVILLIWTGAANVSIITVLLLVVPAIYFALCAGLDNMDAG